VKKDRFRIHVLEAPDESRVPEGLVRGIETCVALFLDKPPAGSPNNFGIAGLRHFAKMLTDKGNAKGWARTFEPGPRLAQALTGTHGQPGVWDWIETWGTASGGDRETYADFVVEAAAWTGNAGLASHAGPLRASATLWRRLAEESMPDDVLEFKALKALKRRHADLWFEKGLEADGERAAIREERTKLTKALEDPAKLSPFSERIRTSMAATVLQIADIEEDAMHGLRAGLRAG
jgi:hypothetical protein